AATRRIRSRRLAQSEADDSFGAPRGLVGPAASTSPLNLEQIPLRRAGQSRGTLRFRPARSRRSKDTPHYDRYSNSSPPGTMRYRFALILLAAIAAAALACDVAVLRAHARPLLDRHSCSENPSSHTLALDTSARGDALYRFVFGTLFGLGSQAPRAGFPHMDVAPVCT